MIQTVPESLQKKKSLRAHLMILVSIALLPTLLFIAILVGVMTYQQVKSLDIGLKGTTRALSASLNNQISTIVSALEILIITEDFENADYKTLHKKLKRAVRDQEGWKSISIAFPTGEQIFNTYIPYGESLPSFKGAPFFEKTLLTKKMTISEYRIGLVSKEPLLSIAIPIKNKKGITHILIGSIDMPALSKSLRQQKLPAHWTAAVLDENATILARNRSMEKYIGTKATNKLAAHLASVDEDVFEDINKEGNETRGAFTKSKYTGWTVAISMPIDEMYGPIWSNLISIAIGAILLLSLGIIMANYYGNRISKPILALAQSGTRAHGEPVQSEVREIAEVAKALDTEAHKAQEAIAIRDTFLSVASHELKTPITSLQLQFQMLTRGLKTQIENDEKVEKSIQKISTQIKRITKLIDELLNITKISSGKLELQYERFKLNHLVEDVVAQFENEAISVSAQDKIEGHWDPSRLEQVITNLTSNAIKYGDGKPVHIELKKDQEFAYIAIKDQGIGIRPEDQTRIFDQFERVQHNHGISGLGMGLWITLKIIKSMDGDIQVESSEGAGSVFTVKLPLERKSGHTTPIFA